MPIGQYEFGTALLHTLRDAVANGRHIDEAIDDYLTVENIDEDDPGLWSDLHHGCHRLHRLIVTDAGKPAPDALKLLVRLGALRDIHGETSGEWFGDGAPSRPDIAIRNLLQTLRQNTPEEGLFLWRLYTRLKPVSGHAIFMTNMAVAA
ncbi:MAG: hypothetical protein FD119_491 [Stygiobacter sp.]|nr:MAG: hypothetical protein FD119_491 [Stygiobacter sp.]